jgi:hypothetical protein
MSYHYQSTEDNKIERKDINGNLYKISNNITGSNTNSNTNSNSNSNSNSNTDNKFQIDYSKMQIGDIWGTVNDTWLAMLIKGKTWGWDKMLSLKHCNHIAVVVQIESQYFLVEALNKIMISSCYKYLNPRFSNMFNQVCFMGRFNGLNEMINVSGKEIEMKRKLNSWLLEIASQYIDYDLSGCIGTEASNIPILHNLFRQNENKFFCSELAIEGIRKNTNVTFLPEIPSYKIEPMHFQRYMPNNILSSILIKNA